MASPAGGAGGGCARSKPAAAYIPPSARAGPPGGATAPVAQLVEAYKLTPCSLVAAMDLNADTKAPIAALRAAQQSLSAVCPGHPLLVPQPQHEGVAALPDALAELFTFAGDKPLSPAQRNAQRLCAPFQLLAEAVSHGPLGCPSWWSTLGDQAAEDLRAAADRLDRCTAWAAHSPLPADWEPHPGVKVDNVNGERIRKAAALFLELTEQLLRALSAESAHYSTAGQVAPLPSRNAPIRVCWHLVAPEDLLEVTLDVNKAHDDFLKALSSSAARTAELRAAHGNEPLAFARTLFPQSFDVERLYRLHVQLFAFQGGAPVLRRLLASQRFMAEHLRSLTYGQGGTALVFRAAVGLWNKTVWSVHAPFYPADQPGGSPGLVDEAFVRETVLPLFAAVTQAVLKLLKVYEVAAAAFAAGDIDRLSALRKSLSQSAASDSNPMGERCPATHRAELTLIREMLRLAANRLKAAEGGDREEAHKAYVACVEKEKGNLVYLQGVLTRKADGGPAGDAGGVVDKASTAGTRAEYAQLLAVCEAELAACKAGLAAAHGAAA